MLFIVSNIYCFPLLYILLFRIVITIFIVDLIVITMYNIVMGDTLISTNDVQVSQILYHVGGRC
jgi:hypothetical protein